MVNNKDIDYVIKKLHKNEGLPRIEIEGVGKPSIEAKNLFHFSENGKNVYYIINDWYEDTSYVREYNTDCIYFKKSEFERLIESALKSESKEANSSITGNREVHKEKWDDFKGEHDGGASETYNVLVKLSLKLKESYPLLLIDEGNGFIEKVNLSQLINNLQDSMWVKLKVLPELDLNSFKEIYACTYSCHNDLGHDWPEKKCLIKEKVLFLDKIQIDKDFLDHYSPIVDIGRIEEPTEKILNTKIKNWIIDQGCPSSVIWDFSWDPIDKIDVDVCILESGRIVFIQSKSEKYDAGKSTSAYGEYGSYVDKRVFALNENLIKPYILKLSDIIWKKIKK